MATPLEVLSAEAAVLDNAASMLALLGYVTSKVREVRRFRADCASLSTTCVSLYSTFLQHRSSLQQTPLRNEFWECIQETSLLVLECLDWNIVHVTFDVIAKHKFTSLKARLGEISKAFGLEVLMNLKGDSTEITTALRSLMAQLNQMQSVQGGESSNVKELLDKFQQLQADSAAIRHEVRSLRPLDHGNLEVLSMSGSAALSVTDRKSDGKPLRGEYQGNPVLLQEILRSNSVSDGLPRVVRLYRDMAEVAQIQRLYGVAEESGVLFAVVEDMDRHIRLAQALEDGTIAHMTRIQKLRVAYELASTVAALHRAKIVIKVLSDTTTYLERLLPDGYIRPRISDLGHARRIWEVTSRDRHDPRFDAPETEPAGSRSTMSDVWGLGVLLHIIFEGGLPFATSSAELKDEEQQRRIKERLRSGQLPFAPSLANAPAELKLAQKCLHAEPYMRPLASWLAEQLFEILIRAGATSTSAPPSHNVALGQPAGAESAERALEMLASLAERASKSPQSVVTIRITELDSLVKASQDANPVCAYALGRAYMHNLIKMESGSVQDTLGVVPERVWRAKAAIPYLEIAEKQGHVGAVKQLVRAHKVLAEYYRDLLKLDMD